MNKLTLTDKRSRAISEIQGERLTMARPGVLVIDAARSEVVGVERIGNGVLVRLRDGKRLAVDDFFRADSSGLIGDIVVREPDGSLHWWSNPLQDWGMARFEPLSAIDPLLLSEPADAGMVVAAFAPGGGLLGVLAGVGALGAAAAAGSGGGNGSTGGGNTTLPPAGGGTVVPPAGGSPLSATVPAATNGLSLAEINSGVGVNITLPSASVAGDRLTVSMDARQAVTLTLSAADITAGRLTVTLPSASVLAAGEGAANVIVTVVDAAGAGRAGSPAAVGVVIDTLAPQLLNPNPNSYADNVGLVQSATSREPVTDDATPGLNIGTIASGTTPALFVNGLRVAATYDATAGTLTPNTPLPNGTHDLTYSLSDAAGNESVRSGALRLTVAAGVASGMSIAIPENSGGGISAAEMADGVAVLVTLPNTLAGGTVGTASAVGGPTAGIFSTSAQNAQAAMVLPLAAAAGDRVSVSIDGGQPVTAVLTSADVAAGRITVILPRSAMEAAGEGVGLVSAVYTTTAGVVSEPVTAEVFIDTLAPVLANPSPSSYIDNVGPVQDAASTAAVTDDTTPGLNIGPVPEGATAVLYVNGTAVAATYDPATGALTPDAPLPNGQARLTYSLKDTVGNESLQSNPLVLTVNNTMPGGLSVLVPANADGGINAAEAAAGVAVIVTLPTGAVAGERVSVSIDNGTPVTVTLVNGDISSGRITVTLPPSAIAAAGQGPGTVSAVFTNAAGATSAPSTVAVSIDTVAPTLTNASPGSFADNVGPVQSPNSTAPVTDDTTPGLNIGALPAGTTPVLLVNGQVVPSTFSPATGTLTPNSPLPNGAADLAFRLRDGAGNESPISNPLRLTVNNTVPTGLSVAVPANADGGINASEAAAGVQVVVSLPAGAAAGESVAVSIDGGAPVNATLTGSDVSAGRITVTLPSSAIAAAGQGPGTVSAVYTNAAGVASSPVTTEVTIDTVAPTLTNASPGGFADNVGPVQSPNSTAPVTDDTTPGLNIGALPAGTTPVLFVNGVAVPATYSAATGTLTPNSPLPNGPADLAYSLKDAAGNESPISNPLRLSISTGAPGALSVSVPENADGGISAAEAADGVLAVVILPNGAAAGDRVAVSIGGGTATTATLTAADVGAGRISITLPATAVQAAGQGASTVSATYTNAAGLSSGPAVADVLIDTVAPGTFTVSVPENGGGGISAAEAADGVAVVVALPTNAAVGDRVAVNIDGGAVVQATLTQADVAARQVTVVLPPAAITAAGEGVGVVRTVYTDAAGNASAASPVNTNVSIDTVAPVLGNASPNSYQDNVGIIQSPMATAPVTDDNTPGLVIGALPAGATPTLFVNGNAVGSLYDAASGTLRPSASLPDGLYDLSYNLRDAVGNESARSNPLRLTIDTVPPQAPSSSITTYRDDSGTILNDNSSAAATDDATPGFRVGALPSDASSAQLFVDGQRVAATYDAATGTLTPTTALLGAGQVQTFQISYTLADAAGNQSGASGNFALTVDAQAPTLNISQSTQPGVPTLTFRFSEAVTGFVAGDVTVTNGTLLNFTAVDDRTFTANVLPTGVSAPTVSVAAGSYTDAVGNAGTAASLATTLTDTTPPVLQSAVTSADGRSLVLTYSETLDSSNLPANNAFTVLSGTPPAPNAVTAIAVTGNTVTLTLTNAIAAGASINLAYADPTANNDMLAIQDVAGNDAATQVSVSVVNQVVPVPVTALITAAITIEPATLAAGQTAAVTITFSGLPTGFTLADLTAEGGTLSGLTTVPQLGINGSATYTATFTPSAGVNDPTNVITLAAGSYTDALGRAGGGATSPNYVVNTTSPTAPITPTFLAISEDTLTGANTSNSDFITNDRILTVSGSINRQLAPGEKVQLQVDGGTWMDAVVNAAEPTVWFIGLNSELAPGQHTFGARVVDSTGQLVGTATNQNTTILANVAPVVATSTNGGLMGIVSLDALGGALNLSQQQQLSAVDVDNNLRQVVVSSGGVANLVNLGTITASQAMAAELGLSAVASSTGGLLGVASTSNLTITAVNGGELDNLRVGELLATINLNSGSPLVSLTALTAVTIAATDANNLTTTANGNVTALSLSALSFVLPGTVIQGTAGAETLNGDANANRLYGYAGNDTLNGGGGDDLLRGGAGIDQLLGGDGNDLLIFDSTDSSIDGGNGVDVLRVETGQLNLVAGTAVRNIETINLGKGDGRNTAVISSAGLLANNSQTVLIEGDQEDAVTLQGATFSGNVLVGRQAFKEYLFTINGQTYTVRIEDGVPITVIGGGG